MAKPSALSALSRGVLEGGYAVRQIGINALNVLTGFESQ
jgi:hypothetical protein